MKRQPSTTSTRHQVVTRAGGRRGVASVLAMMFMVIFGSLAAAMAVVAQGNMRTADSGLRMSRAMSAAETGLVFAEHRLMAEAKRFVVEKGTITPGYAEDIWVGTFDTGADGAVVVLAPQGYTVVTPPSGLAEAVRDAHLADEHSLVAETGDAALPEIDEAYGTLRVRPIRLCTSDNGPYFRLKYELVSGEPSIRVTSVGVDGAIRRTLQMDFRLDKRIEFAILSPNRIMIGKNVRVEGPLGSRYGVATDDISAEDQLDPKNGDPLVLRSDFYWLDTTLNAKLDLFYGQVADYDVDGDARLRPDHPIEGKALAGFGSLLDYDEDEYVDDFDLFMAHFDGNNDKMVAYDATLTAAAGLGSLSEEFANVDNQLARLIDEANADRDGDGVITDSDRALGYRDGVIDANDLYAKVRGTIAFGVARDTWQHYHGDSYQSVVQGAVRPDIDEAPVTFEVTEDDMREITTEMVADAQSWLESQVPAGPDDFWTQATASGTYTPHAAGSRWEAVPYGSSAAYDYYPRDVFDGVTFRDVRIPMGCNGLFVDCTFIGVTFIECEQDCAHIDWNYTDAREEVEDPAGSGNWTYPVRFPDLVATLTDGTPVVDSRAMSNNLRFHDCTFLGSIAGTKPDQYTHWRNKVQITGQTRFYSDPADEDLADQADAAALTNALTSINDADLEEIQKSSILMPGWSFDVGNFDNQQAVDPDDTPKIKLKGTIISGILDIRGTADVHGTILMTYRPIPGEGPLAYGGLPDAFNTTIGYFEPEAGGLEGKPLDEIQAQGFGEITLRYNPDAKLPDGIPWPISIQPEASTYSE